MNGEITELKNDLETLRRRVAVLEIQGRPLPNGGLATLIAQHGKFIEKIDKLKAALLCIAEILTPARKAQVQRKLS